MKKSIFAAIAFVISMSVNAQSNHFGVGLNTKMCFQDQVLYGAKALAPSIQLTYEMNAEPCFALELAGSFGYYYTEAEKHFEDYNYAFKGMSASADIDLYGKLVFDCFQLIAGVGCAYRQPTNVENIMPVDYKSMWYTYGHAASGIKASAGFGATIFEGSETGRVDVRALWNIAPYTNSGKNVFKTGVEVGIVCYM